ncbi:nicotinamidase [Bifidobacterium rousetti]|uniref:isochorismatase family protein n=1 Tax=Bifidobacterium rousetti TaxID=2045439 RepID=UPI001238D2E2|nr:isochorismatase family protein [Bifidobacterium rousetti]KAA8820570.1 nicotinamidase [Bifidobacterium rousetti]
MNETTKTDGAAKALIVVDVQPTFCEGGELGVDGGDAVAERIAAYVRRHRGDYAFIATTQDWHIEPGAHWSDHSDFVDTWPVHGRAGSPNARLHPAIEGLGIAHHFKKGQYSAAYSGFEGIEDNTESIQSRAEVEAAQEAGHTLANALKATGVTRVDVVGIAESHCVKETALDALRLGYQVNVFEDLTVPVSEELGVAARGEMAGAGVTLAESQTETR